jgi:hypothetical protein
LQDDGSEKTDKKGEVNGLRNSIAEPRGLEADAMMEFKVNDIKPNGKVEVAKQTQKSRETLRIIHKILTCPKLANTGRLPIYK